MNFLLTNLSFTLILKVLNKKRRRKIEKLKFNFSSETVTAVNIQNVVTDNNLEETHERK